MSLTRSEPLLKDDLMKCRDMCASRCLEGSLRLQAEIGGDASDEQKAHQDKEEEKCCQHDDSSLVAMRRQALLLESRCLVDGHPYFFGALSSIVSCTCLEMPDW